MKKKTTLKKRILSILLAFSMISTTLFIHSVPVQAETVVTPASGTAFTGGYYNLSLHNQGGGEFLSLNGGARHSGSAGAWNNASKYSIGSVRANTGTHSYPMTITPKTITDTALGITFPTFDPLIDYATPATFEYTYTLNNYYGILTAIIKAKITIPLLNGGVKVLDFPQFHCYNLPSTGDCQTIAAGTWYSNYTPETKTYHDPIVTHIPDMTVLAGTTIGASKTWTTGIRATWGVTTSNLIPNQGSITDDTVNSLGTQLSSTGSKWDQLGWELHDYSIRDSHSLDTVTPAYSGDTTSVAAARKVIVQAISAPGFDVNLAGTTTPYDGSYWLSPNGATADAARQTGVDLVSKTSDAGTYDIVIKNGSAEAVSESKSNPLPSPTEQSTSINNYTNDSPAAAGESFTTVLLGTGDHSIALSPETTPAKEIKIDSQAPNAPTVTDTSFGGDFSSISANATDNGASGLPATDAYYYQFVPSGSAAPGTPSGSDAGWASVDSYALPGTPGNYDLYVYAKDQATNRSAVTKGNVSNPIQVRSGLAPDIAGEIASGSAAGTPVASGTWVNADGVRVKASEPNPGEATTHYNALYQDTIPATQEAKSAAVMGTVDKTYQTETADSGIALFGVMVDAGDIELSAHSTPYIVKVDTSLPTANGKAAHQTGNQYILSDNGSADNVGHALGYAGSGINSSSIRFAVVPDGDPFPLSYTSYTYDDHGGVAQDFSALGAGTYDIYAIVKDNAGNISSPAKAADQIIVKDLNSANKPTLTGKVSAATKDKDGIVVAANSNYTSGTWINQPIELTATKNGKTYAGKHNVDIMDGVVTAKAGTGNVGADTTYQAATEGKMSYESVVVDTTLPVNNELSVRSDELHVWLDTKAPVNSISTTDQWTTHTDSSYDDTSATPDVSGIYKTFLNFVPAGTTGVDYHTTGWKDAAGASLTATGTWDVYSYTVDHAGNRSAVAVVDTNVSIISSQPPLLSAIYSAGATDKDGKSVAGTAYDGSWTNDAVDLTLTTPEMASGLYGILYHSGIPFTNGAMISQKYSKGGYHTESTGVMGTDLTGKVALNAALTGLSPVSNTLNVKIDTIAPVTAIIANVGNATFSDASTDDKAGVYQTRVAYVAKDAAAPAAGAYAEISTVTITTPGEYDIWAYTIDEAGNRSAAAKELSGIKVVSSTPAELKATYDDNGTIKNYIPGTWINQDIILTASKPAGFTYTGNYNSAVYYNGTAQFGKGTDNAGGDYTYTSNSSVVDETVFALLVDDSDAAVSAPSASIQVKVDQVAPNAVASIAPVTWEILDQSTDAHSGVDHSKTQVAIVPHGSPAPGVSAFSPLSGQTIPATGLYYDVYMIVYDHAGNTSGVMEVLGNRSTNPKDEITAGNFERGLNEGTLTDNDARVLADVTGNYYTIMLPALPITQSDIDVDGPMLSAINGQITSGILGMYDLQFTTPTTTPPRPLTSANPAYSEQADVKVKLYQYGGGTPGTEKIYGNDFAYAVKNGSLDDARAKILATVFAREADCSVMDLSKVSVDPLELADINTAVAAKDVDHNTWPLTFTTPGGVAVTVQVSLFDYVTPEPVTPGDEMIAANDFAFGMDQGALTDRMAKFLSNVFAKDGSGNAIPKVNLTVDAAELAAINAAISAGDKSGNPFPLSFETPGNKRVTVKVTLYDHSNPPVVGQALIVGDDFRYAIPNGAISSNLARELAKAAAKDANGVKIPVANITVDGPELTAINAAIAAGTKTTLPLTFTEPSGEWATVKVTLYQNGPVPPTPNEEEIFANDFSYGISSGAMSQDSAKILSQVYAHYANGADVKRNDITVDAAELAVINAMITVGDKSGNPFPLTFRSPGGKQVTIQVTLKDRGPVVPPAAGQEYITGNDFFYGMDQGSLTDINAKFLSQIDPRNADGSVMNPASVTVDAGELTAINTAISSRSKAGNPFDLTYRTPDGTSATVKVTLYDRSNPPAVNRAFIAGNDFSYGISQGTITDDIARIYARVKAADGNANPIAAANISVDPAELADINTAITAGDKSGNPFPLTFTEPSGESVTVFVTLKDRGAGPDAVTLRDAIAANDFIYGVNEGALTEAVSKFRSQVTGVDRNGNPYALSALTTDPTELTAINNAITAGQVGTYPLTYTTPDGTSVTIQVLLRDQATNPTPDPSDPSKTGSGNIGANDFTASANNPAPLSDQDARDEAKAIAKDKFGTDFPSASIHVDAAELSVINAAKAAGTIGDYPLTFTSPEGKSVTITVSLRAVYTITLNYVDRQGNPVRASETETVSPGLYTKTAPAIAEKVFVDWSKDAGNPMANLEGNTIIRIANVTSDMTLTLVYGQDKGGSGPDGKVPDGIEDFTITEQYIGNGAVIAGNTERYINRGTTYMGSPLSISGYTYTGYQVNGGAFWRGANPTIANVQTTHTVTMHYAVVTTPTPPAKPNPPGDNGNYNFIKKPNVKNVAAGQTVNYTFSGFGNQYPISLENYIISDIPEKGLDFVSAKLPAFRNGKGVTYEVGYTTNKRPYTVLHANIPADQSFSFKAPKLQKGEYITGLDLKFGTVPSGFAVGNTINMTFRVWDNPPKETLINVGMLTYRVNGRDKQFITGGKSTAITIDGWFDAPKTGDTDDLFVWYGAIAFTLIAMLLTAMEKKKRKIKE